MFSRLQQQKLKQTCVFSCVLVFDRSQWHGPHFVLFQPDMMSSGRPAAVNNKSRMSGIKFPLPTPNTHAHTHARTHTHTHTHTHTRLHTQEFNVTIGNTMKSRDNTDGVTETCLGIRIGSRRWTNGCFVRISFRRFPPRWPSGETQEPLTDHLCCLINVIMLNFLSCEWKQSPFIHRNNNSSLR